MPEGDGRLPEGDGRLPEGDGRLPGGDGRLPEGDGRLPEGDGRLPEGDGRLPEGDGRLPEGDGRLPEGDGRLPEGGGRLPEGGGRLAEGGGRLADGDGRLPEGDGQAPEGDGRLPGGDGRLPEGDGRLPEGGGRERRQAVVRGYPDGHLRSSAREIFAVSKQSRGRSMKLKSGRSLSALPNRETGRPWSSIEKQFAEVAKTNPAFAALAKLSSHLANSSFAAAGLCGATSMHDLAIGPSTYVFQNRHLRIEWDFGTKIFTMVYVDGSSTPWERSVRSGEIAGAVDRFIVKRARWYRQV